MRIILVTLLLVSGTVFAETTKPKFGVDVEPIIGYERVQKLVPTPHTKDRLFYGARVLIGVPLISGETEYVRATDTETFTGLSTTDTADRVKVGLRSSLALGKTVRVFGRAGGQATQNVHSETISGVTTTETEAIKYQPYAGAGVRVGMGRRFTLSGDLTAVFQSTSQLGNPEWQAALGFSVRFP